MLVEIILQVVENIKNSKILIATQSNSAANVIAQRLIDSGLGANDLIRLLSFKYSCKKLLPETLSPYCSTVDELNSDQNLKFFERLKELKNYPIVIATTNTYGQVMESFALRDHFTHAFIDEAGQATELDVLIPMVLVGKKGQVVMAGDEV